MKKMQNCKKSEKTEIYVRKRYKKKKKTFLYLLGSKKAKKFTK
jgi:hypothetical protein